MTRPKVWRVWAAEPTGKTTLAFEGSYARARARAISLLLEGKWVRREPVEGT